MSILSSSALSSLSIRWYSLSSLTGQSQDKFQSTMSTLLPESSGTVYNLQETFIILLGWQYHVVTGFWEKIGIRQWLLLLISLRIKNIKLEFILLFGKVFIYIHIAQKYIFNSKMFNIICKLIIIRNQYATVRPLERLSLIYLI